MIQKCQLGHLSVTTGSRDAVLRDIVRRVTGGERCYCVPINVTKYGMTRPDVKMRRVVNAADYVIADGLPMVWLARRLGHENVHRVTGIDLAESIINYAQQHDWRLFFLGATPDNLQRMVTRLHVRYPGTSICGARHGYFRPSDLPGVIKEINASRPDILFLGLGLPQKEYFVADHFDSLRVPFCMTVGGAFDVWCGVKRRTPDALQRVGLEWLFRVAHDWRKSLTLGRYAYRFFLDYALLPRSTRGGGSECLGPTSVRNPRQAARAILRSEADVYR